jgi:hypothetical protein
METKNWVRVGVTERDGSALTGDRYYTNFWMVTGRLHSRKKLVGEGMSHSVMITWASSEERRPLLNREVEPTFENGAEIKVLVSTETRPGASNADAALLAYEVSPGVWVPNVK